MKAVRKKKGFLVHDERVIANISGCFSDFLIQRLKMINVVWLSFKVSPPSLEFHRWGWGGGTLSTFKKFKINRGEEAVYVGIQVTAKRSLYINHFFCVCVCVQITWMDFIK